MRFLRVHLQVLVDRPSVAQAFAVLAPALTQEGAALPPEFLL